MAAEDHMDIALSPELEAFVNEKVRSGRYLSAGEVIREALRVLEERDRREELDLADLRNKVAAGLEQLDRGEAWDLPDDIEEAVEEIESRGRRRFGLQMDPCP
jgi:antitoxin ParD1/3/4